NKSCYDDFATYLISKHPNRNIHRNKNQSVVIPQIKESNMIIITESEKDAILKQYNIPTTKKSELSMDTFLEYLTNPTILQMFQIMLNQLNQLNVHNNLNKYMSLF